MSPRPVALSWSSGKDAAWALRVLHEDETVEVRALLTTFNEAHDRAAMHGVRRTLVRAQAEAVGLPLLEVGLPWPCPNETYEARLAEALVKLREDWHVTALAFGDLFLEDVRAYRCTQLEGTGVEPLFPIWGRPTAALAREMIAAGVDARLSCVDTRVLDAAFAGRRFDAALLAALPGGVDPCGENGEFHTLVLDGPAFAQPVRAVRGETVVRDGFAFADFEPVSDTEATPACAS